MRSPGQTPVSPLGLATITPAAVSQPAYITGDLEVPVVTTKPAPSRPLPPPKLALDDLGTDPIDFLAIANNNSSTNSNGFDPGWSQGNASDITDDGFTFNPWMGFPGGGNIYGGLGMSWRMGQEGY